MSPPAQHGIAHSFDASLTYGIRAGNVPGMAAVRKITIHVPEDLLRRAQEATGEGITPTIRRALEVVAAGRAYDELRRLRGRVHVSVTAKDLREDDR